MNGKVRLTLAALAGALLWVATAYPLQAGTGPAAATKASASQLQGVYRFNLGKVRITALSDGTLPLDLHPLLRGISPAQIDALLQKGFARNPLETSINAYVVDSGSYIALIDTGAGELFGAVGGQLLRSLAAAGYRPEQISDVLITHIHTDHSGGLIRGGQRLFPNATVHIGQPDIDFFLDPANLGKGLKAKHLEEAQNTVGPYLDAGKVRTFSGTTQILPGIMAIPTPGHTPGHAFYSVESEGESIEFWGDILHVGLVQFAQPQVTIEFDVDQNAARAQRLQQFAAAAQGRKRVAAAHLPFPGVGYMRPEGAHYQWVPAEYRNRD
ncbi:MAG: MBL fold metallo-hydrolase [Pseudomonas sp.]|uniref:MBL fold metallo-hydrolase n=1 Tax=Pseudomonas sp. TaxID=306 RepID=UPI0033990304